MADLHHLPVHWLRGHGASDLLRKGCLPDDRNHGEISSDVVEQRIFFPFMIKIHTKYYQTDVSYMKMGSTEKKNFPENM